MVHYVIALKWDAPRNFWRGIQGHEYRRAYLTRYTATRHWYSSELSQAIVYTEHGNAVPFCGADEEIVALIEEILQAHLREG